MHIYCILDCYSLNINILEISILKENDGIFDLDLLMNNTQVQPLLLGSNSLFIDGHNSLQFLWRMGENSWKWILMVTK
jgi:hypothetical protein